MRNALNIETLHSVYSRVAGHYDFQHGFLTARSDQRGRRLIVEKTVQPADHVLDCGAGTGSTGLLAARVAGSDGHVTLFDLSADMLAVARKKALRLGMQKRIEIQTGDMTQLPFPDSAFDVVLSSYSLCPLYDPAAGALEMYRVVKSGGLIGISHSTDPTNRVAKWLADKVEDVVWHFPQISLGCRSVQVLPALTEAGGEVNFKKYIGVPLWPFIVFVVRKP